MGNYRTTTVYGVPDNKTSKTSVYRQIFASIDALGVNLRHYYNKNQIKAITEYNKSKKSPLETQFDFPTSDEMLLLQTKLSFSIIFR